MNESVALDALLEAMNDCATSWGVAREASLGCRSEDYYEHVIRDEQSLTRIREYIRTNPLRWHVDRENPDCTGNDDVWNSLLGPVGTAAHGRDDSGTHAMRPDREHR